MYYPCSETEGADQLRSHCKADLCLCFRLCGGSPQIILIVDGISFVRTLTRNVISLWDDVSTPRHDYSSLFSQPVEYLSSNDPKILLETSVDDDDSATRSITSTVSRRRRKSQRRLLFSDGEGNNTKADVTTFDSDFPFHVIGKTLNKTPKTNVCSMYKQYSFGLKDMLLPTRYKNFTFPLYMPLKASDNRVPLFLRALNLSVRWDNATSTLQNRNNNSFTFLRLADSAENNELSTQIKEDTKEFENDINFLSTVANKMSTPIKAFCPKEAEPSEYEGQVKSLGSYARLAEGLNRIFTSNFEVTPALQYCETYKSMRGVQHFSPSPFQSPEDSSLTLASQDNQERMTPRFASEDEEAVYYLITKYLQD